MFVLLIYSLRLSDLLDPLQFPTVILVAGTSLSFVLGWLLESVPNYGRLATATVDLKLLAETINSKRVGKRLKLMWAIFALGVSFEIAFFGGTPLWSLIGIGAQISYKDFGIQGFHGLLNALFYTGCVVAFARILFGSSTRILTLMTISIGYPLLVVSRQILMSLILQYVLIYFSIRRPSPRIFVRVGAILGAILLIFGYLGDARSGRDSIIALASPTFDYPDWLPSAFIWVYIYLSSPLNNVNYNIDISPNYLPIETAGSFIPSFAREDFLAAFGGSQQWDLVSDSFNVGSLLQSLLTDFGIYGSIVFTLFCGTAFSFVRRRSLTSPAAFFAIIVILHGIALSFFANLLFHLVFVFEILATAWVLRQASR
jgi:oligosaccharide repeat unit polymerase